MEKPNDQTIKASKQHRVPTTSAVLSDGTLVEMVYEPDAKRSLFVCYRNGSWRLQERVPIGPSQLLVPYSTENNLLKHDVVLFPSQVQEYDSEEELLGQIQSFIHRYVDVSPLF